MLQSGVVRRLVLILLLVAMAAVPSGGAAGRQVLLGVLGNPDHFRSVTDQDSQVRHIIMGYGQNTGRRLDHMLGEMGPIPMLGFGMEGWTSRQMAGSRGWPATRTEHPAPHRSQNVSNRYAAGGTGHPGRPPA